MKNRVTTFDELVERARALEPTTLEVNAVLARVSTSPPRPPRRLRRPSWRMTAAVLAVAVGAPATALAVSKLISPGQVANSLPAGAFLLRGTKPTCTTVTAGSVYRCTLAIRPASRAGPGQLDREQRADRRCRQARQRRMRGAERTRDGVDLLRRPSRRRSQAHPQQTAGLRVTAVVRRALRQAPRRPDRV